MGAQTTNSKKMSEMSVEELAAQALEAWSRVHKAVATLARAKTRLEDIHGLLVEFAERYIDPEKLHKGKLIDLPLGKPCLLHSGAQDWVIVIAQEVSDESLCVTRKEIMNLDGEREYGRFEVHYDCHNARLSEWAWAELAGEDNVFSNPKFRRDET